MSNNYPYGAPPPPPPPSGYGAYSPGYGAQQPPRGAANGNRGRGYQHGGFQPAPAHTYPQYVSPQQPQYGQQWQADQRPAAGSMAPQPYPQTYQHGYGQPTYTAAPPQGYPQGYSAGSTYQQDQYWTAPQPNHAAPSRSGRGGVGNDPGGRAYAAPPPIRMGFNESPPAQNYVAPAYDTRAGGNYQQPAYNNFQPSPPVPHSYSQAPNHWENRRGGRGTHHHHGGRARQFNDRRGPNGRPQMHRDQNGDNSDSQTARKKKRKTNTLGLTPQETAREEEEDEDDEDDEARIAHALGSNLPVIDNMENWLKERREKYPTRARIQAKKAEVGDQDAQDKAEAAKLRQQLATVEKRMQKRKRDNGDEGDEARAENGTNGPDISDESDIKPEAMSTRQNASTDPAAHPSARADPTSHCKYYSTGGTCGKKTKCRFVHDPAEREKALKERADNGGKLTLSQRLLLNDKSAEEMAVVSSIKSLRKAGRLPQTQGQGAEIVKHEDEPTVPNGAQNRSQHHAQNQSQARSQAPAQHSHQSHPLDASHHSFQHQPRNTPQAHSHNPTNTRSPPRRYEGWNLSGYGNSGVREEDDLP